MRIVTSGAVRGGGHRVISGIARQIFGVACAAELGDRLAEQMGKRRVMRLVARHAAPQVDRPVIPAQLLALPPMTPVAEARIPHGRVEAVGASHVMA